MNQVFTDITLQQNIKINGLCYNTNFRCFTSNTNTIPLRSQLDKVFCALFNKKNQVITREELIERVWDGNHFTGAKALTHSICKLRKIFVELGDEKTRIITIPKYGYCLKI